MHHALLKSIYQVFKILINLYASHVVLIKESAWNYQSLCILLMTYNINVGSYGTQYFM